MVSDQSAPPAAEAAVVVGPWAAVSAGGDSAALTFLSLPGPPPEALPDALALRTLQLESLARITQLAADLSSAAATPTRTQLLVSRTSATGIPAASAIVEEISRTSGFPVVVLEAYDEVRQVMVFAAATGVPEIGQGSVFEVPLDQALGRFAVRGGEPVIQVLTDDESADSVLLELGIRTLVCVPIRVGGRVIGVLSLSHAERVQQTELLLPWLRTIANVLAGVLDRTQQQRDDFLSIAAHELQTPVTALSAYVQLLGRRLARDGADPAAVRDGFAVLAEQTTRLSRLVHQLLDVSRLEAGKLKMDLQTCDLAALVRRAMSTTQSLTDRHALRLKAPARLDATVDPTRIEQVLTNLLSNAVRYSPDGGAIDVEVGETADTVYVAVRDHGIGIPPADRERIFDRLYQAEATSVGGLGLGLYISAQIVQQHGGRLEVESPADGGARLVVSLPRGSRD